MEQKSATESLSSFYQKLSNDQKLLIKITSIIFIAFMIYKSGYIIGKAIYKTMH